MPARLRARRVRRALGRPRKRPEDRTQTIDIKLPQRTVALLHRCAAARAAAGARPRDRTASHILRDVVRARLPLGASERPTKNGPGKAGAGVYRTFFCLTGTEIAKLHEQLARWAELGVEPEYLGTRALIIFLLERYA